MVALFSLKSKPPPKSSHVKYFAVGLQYTSVMFVQFKNARAPIWVIVAGRVIVVRAVQPLNAMSPMVSSPLDSSARITEDKFKQYAKATLLIVLRWECAFEKSVLKVVRP